MRAINKIIIHCTATKEGQAVTVADVIKWHKARGFNTIGYHFLIDLNGILWTGRAEDLVGAHCEGQNANSIGVCYVGGLDANLKSKDTRTPSQKEALISLLKFLKKRYPNATIHGHREFANKACPCFDAKNEYKNL
ncbi:MAG: N-acetylmuramoyl-L-alanine amidase [Lentimicrobiaceae bacterium]|nr:N-acetylmuramoyl-L-alanine amidase [Lentimicrobiaceae bacterium]